MYLSKPNVLLYRCYKNFDHDIFRSHLLKELSSSNLKKDEFDKEKYIRYNRGSFITNDLRKAIMNRSRLLNKFRKKNTDQNKWAYKKQRNLCLKLLKRSKKTFYNTLDVKKLDAFKDMC